MECEDMNYLSLLESQRVRIAKLEGKLNELIHHINWIANYYECKGDYAGSILDLEGKNEL